MLKCKGTRQHNILTKKGKDVTNPRDIANAFNNLSIDTGPTLSKTIPSSQNKNLRFFKNRSLNSLLLKPNTQYEIQKLISNLHNTKALCSTSIPATIFKNNLDIL